MWEVILVKTDQINIKIAFLIYSLVDKIVFNKKKVLLVFVVKKAKVVRSGYCFDGRVEKGIAIHRREDSFRGRKIFVRKEAFK